MSGELQSGEAIPSIRSMAKSLHIVSAILTPLTGEMNMKHSLVGAISTMIALGIFIGSYFISIKIYQNKEFA